MPYIKAIQIAVECANENEARAERKYQARSISYHDAMLAVEWLNATQRTAAYRRVLMVRRELEELGTMLNELRHKEQAREQRNQFRERHNAFNKKIARYTYISVLDYSRDYGIWRFNAVPKRSRGSSIAVSDGYSRVRADEGDVIAALCRLAANRELHKVRLCEMCGERWRVSERKMDRFCSQKCREAFNAKSSEFRERKAENQRKYRNNLKARGLV